MADIKHEKYVNEVSGEKVASVDEAQRGSIDDELPSDNADHLQRRLGNRQIQLIAIGGSIGTAVFVSINSGLAHGGPGALLLAYAIYSCFLGLINNCMAEMTVLHPVSGGFIRMAGHWVDDAFGFMAGWNVSITCTLRLITLY
jgi:yeast amino acid transporter